MKSSMLARINAAMRPPESFTEIAGDSDSESESAEVAENESPLEEFYDETTVLDIDDLDIDVTAVDLQDQFNRESPAEVFFSEIDRDLHIDAEDDTCMIEEEVTHVEVKRPGQGS